MELAHSLTLNEEALKKLPDNRRPVFIYEWLRFVNKILTAVQKSDIKEIQQKLQSQLSAQLHGSSGAPTRRILSVCIANYLSVGDTIALFDTLNACNDILRQKEDASNAQQQLATKLAACTAIGTMFEKLGRLMGRSFEETVTGLLKLLKHAEAPLRFEILSALERIVLGLGTAASGVHKDVYKAARTCITDRSLPVRCAAARCIAALAHFASFLHTTELDAVVLMSMRALDGSNADVRVEVGRMLATVLGRTQVTAVGYAHGQGGAQQSNSAKKERTVSFDELLALLAPGLLRTNVGLFGKVTGGSSNSSSAAQAASGQPGMVPPQKATDPKAAQQEMANREMRIGVAHAYVYISRQLGAAWFERQYTSLLAHFLGLLQQSQLSRASLSHGDAVHLRRTLAYILGASRTALLTERQQLAIARDLVSILARMWHAVASTSQPVGTDKDTNVNAAMANETQLSFVLALSELTSLVDTLNASAAQLLAEETGSGTGAPQHISLVDTLMAIAAHPMPTVRVHAALAIRAVALAVPANLSTLLDRTLKALGTQKQNAEAVHGYGLTLAALTNVSRVAPLGVPCSRVRAAFGCGEELLRTAKEHSRLAFVRTQAGWHVLGACATLTAAAHVRAHLPRLFAFWKNAFPRSAKELTEEAQRGDAFTWQITLESRCGALSALQAFLEAASSAGTGGAEPLLNEDALRRIGAPVERAIAMLQHLAAIVRQFGVHLRANAAQFRTRLYTLLSLLPTHVYSAAFAVLLRELVADLTLNDNPANTCSSLLIGASHALFGQTPAPDGDGAAAVVLLGDAALAGVHIEETVALPSGTSAQLLGALENDPAAIYLRSLQTVDADSQPAPAPIGVALLDASVRLFAYLFPRIASKHRLQIIEHFTQLLKQVRAQRFDCLLFNCTLSIAYALRECASALDAGADAATAKSASAAFSDAELRKAVLGLLTLGLSNGHAATRFVAADCVARIAALSNSARFTEELLAGAIERIKTNRDATVRSAHALLIGAVHRHVGALATSAHLQNSVSLLFALAQDGTSVLVQTWSVCALTQIAEASGPLFRGYTEPCLHLIAQLLLGGSSVTSQYSISQSGAAAAQHGDAFALEQSVGRLLSALITILGPELASNTNAHIIEARQLCLSAAQLLEDHTSSRVQQTAIGCLQQMHLFAPAYVNLKSLIVHLLFSLSSPNAMLRRAASSCLRQLCQRESKAVAEQLAALAACTSKDGGPNTALASASSSGQPFLDISGCDYSSWLTEFTLTTADAGQTSLLSFTAQTTLQTVLEQHVRLDAETGLEGFLFARLDTETDASIRAVLQDTLRSVMLTASGTTDLTRWLAIIRTALEAYTNERQADAAAGRAAPNSGKPQSSSVSAAAASKLKSKAAKSKVKSSGKIGRGDHSDSDDEDGDDASGNEDDLDAKIVANTGDDRRSATRWTSKVFAIECLQRLVDAADGGAQARLIASLSEIIRMCFIAATCANDRLRLLGLSALQSVIRRFAHVAEPDFPGHVVLEQYQAQVGAALRPAFAADTPSDVTALACQVSSTWITSQVARDLNDLRRVQQLLDGSLEKLKRTAANAPSAYSEAAITMEKLAVLRAWSEVYTKALEFTHASSRRSASHEDAEDSDTELPPNALDLERLLGDARKFEAISMRGDGGRQDADDADGERNEQEAEALEMRRNTQTSLLSFVEGELPTLNGYWMAALRDYALLSLPAELSSVLPPEGGTFYHADLVEQSRAYFRHDWATILYAVCVSLRAGGRLEQLPANRSLTDEQTEQLHLIMSVALESLANLHLAHTNDSTIALCIRSLHTLFVHTDAESDAEAEIDANEPRRNGLGSSLTWPAIYLVGERQLFVEFLRILHRLMLVKDSLELHAYAFSILSELVRAARYRRAQAPRGGTITESTDSQISADSQSESTAAAATAAAAADESNKLLDPVLIDGNPNSLKDSPVYALLEIAYVTLVRYSIARSPALQLASGSTASAASLPNVLQVPGDAVSAQFANVQIPRLHIEPLFDNEDQNSRQQAASQLQLILRKLLALLTDVLDLCTPTGLLAVLPSCVNLLLSIVQFACVPMVMSGSRAPVMYAHQPLTHAELWSRLRRYVRAAVGNVANAPQLSALRASAADLDDRRALVTEWMCVVGFAVDHLVRTLNELETHTEGELASDVFVDSYRPLFEMLISFLRHTNVACYQNEMFDIVDSRLACGSANARVLATLKVIESWLNRLWFDTEPKLQNRVKAISYLLKLCDVIRANGSGEVKFSRLTVHIIRQFAPLVLADAVQRFQAGNEDRVVPRSFAELALYEGEYQLCESLVANVASEADSSARFTLLNVLVPLLINSLPSQLPLLYASRNANELQATVRRFYLLVLDRLERLGQTYTAEMKQLLQVSAPLRQKFESAVRQKYEQQANATALAQTQQRSDAQRSANRDTNEARAPIIQLRMDFSNYK